MTSMVLERDSTIGLIGDLAASIDEPFDDNYQTQIAAPMIQEIVLPHGIRNMKVFRIRQQLSDGNYNIDERLDAVLEQILDDVNL